MSAIALVGIGGFFTFGRDDGPRPAVARAAPVQATSVVTVKGALPPGHLIRPDDVTTLAWPADKVPAAAIVDGTPAAAKLAGSVTRRAFVAGEMIVAGSVITPGDRGFLAAIVAPGKRAVAVSVDAASAAGGLIWPGDRVDVILTQEITGDQIQPVRKVVSETLLVDTRVLSSDQRMGNASEPTGTVADATKPSAPQVPTTVTLEVTQADAERVAVAAALGRLSLTLRASLPGAGAEAVGSATWAGGVSPALRSVPGPKPATTAVAAPAKPAAEKTTRIFRGSAAGA